MTSIGSYSQGGAPLRAWMQRGGAALRARANPALVADALPLTPRSADTLFDLNAGASAGFAAFAMPGEFQVECAPLARLEGQIAIGTLLSNLAQSRARCSTSSVAVLHGNPRLEAVAGGLLRGCLESAYRRKTIQHQPHPGDVQHRFPRSVLGIRGLC
jgi:hypothetical protein